jgi:hypothetical protein
MRTDAKLPGAREAIELVCDKIGVVLLVLGIMHFFNLYVFNRLRKRGNERGDRSRFAPDPGWSPQGAPLGKVLD